MRQAVMATVLNTVAANAIGFKLVCFFPLMEIESESTDLVDI